MSRLQPLNGGLPRRAPSPYDPNSSRGWHKCSMILLTVFTSALLATLVTFGVLNYLLDDMTLPPLQNRLGNYGGMHGMNLELVDSSSRQQQQQQQLADGTAELSASPPPPVASPPPALPPPPPPAKMVHPFSNLQHIYTLAPTDTSSRCQRSQICDGDHSCGPDGLGCVTAAKDRQAHVKKAIAWAWEGYRKYAWGHDEVDAKTQSPHAWFNLGLTIVDSLDTLLLAGLQEEYQQARHWVANHLVFQDGHNVQFFEVNIRILGGLLSAYYLSDGDDLYLHKAQQLADRLMVAFNTTSGIPTTFVNFKNAEGRANSGIGDSQTNQAEAGTISMEFTTIGRLLGRDDMFDAGSHFWYVLMSTRNYSGLYCMGISTRTGECADAKMTIGSAADSMYEYMLKQWVLSNKTQEIPLQLYKEAMTGVRKYLVRHIYDGTANMSFVSEAQANQYEGTISDVSDRFEHLTCFAGGMFILGKLHNISTNVTPADVEDIMLGARIGRACYELYHQSPSGVAPDSVRYERQGGGRLPPSSSERGPELGFSPSPSPVVQQVHLFPLQQQHQQHQQQQQQHPKPQNLHKKKHKKKKRMNQLKAQQAAAAAAQQQQAQQQQQQQQQVPQEQKPATTQTLNIQPRAKQGAVAAGHVGQQRMDLPHLHQGQHLAAQLAAQQQAQQQVAAQQQQTQATQLPADAPKTALPVTANQQQQGAEHRAQAMQDQQGHNAAAAGAGATAPAQQQQQKEDAPIAKEQPLNIVPGGHPAGNVGAGVVPHRHLLMAEGQQLELDNSMAHTVATGHDEPDDPAAADSTEAADNTAADGAVDGDGADGAVDVDGAVDGNGNDGAVDAGSNGHQTLAAADGAVRSLLQDDQVDGADAGDGDAADPDATPDADTAGDGKADEAAADDTGDAAAAADAADAADAPQQAGQQGTPAEEEEEEEEEEVASPPPPPASPPPPPPSPPPPAGPIIATWSQMSHADFLRPEAIETLFYLWRATGDEIYREWGWNMFRGFERWCRLASGGYATVDDVNQVPPSLANKMESFFVAETLKYFLLLFEDDPNVVPLDQWVLNTEAHPIPIWGTPADKRAMDRTRQRRRAAKLERQRREAEAAALREQAELEAKKGGSTQNRGDGQGYGLAGVQM